MKFLIKGNVFNPTGVATGNREIAKALHKLGHEVQVTDPFHSRYEFNEGLEYLNKPIETQEDDECRACEG